MTAHRTAVTVVAIVVGMGALAAPARATEEVTQAESADPVLAGTTVGYTMTVTNTTAEPEELWLGTLLTKAGSDGAVEDAYLSISSPVGSCSIDPIDSFGYRSATCNLGTLAPGQTVTVQDAIRADFSLEHLATTFDCDPGLGCEPGLLASERTSVIHPPEITGSDKLRFGGLPQTCASADFKLKVKARGHGVRNIAAELSGPRSEYGVFEAGDLFTRQAKKAGRSLRLKVPGATLEEGFYKVAVLALRGGAPKLKGTATFQIC